MNLPAGAATLAGPDGRIELEFGLTDAGAPVYSVRFDGRVVLEESALGVVREDADFSTGLDLLDSTSVETVVDRYELYTSKRRLNVYRGNARSLHLATADGKKMIVDFRVSDDGIAFRYHFPETSGAVHRIRRESTNFRLPDGARAWLQPAAPAKSGWSSTNPSYEELYLRDVEPGTESPLGRDWVLPALFRAGDTWLLVSETGLARNYCGSRLASAWRSPVYSIAFPEPAEHFMGGPVTPESTLPWTTPWRLVVIGDLETVVESSLGTDLATPAASKALASADWPGKAAWSWALLKDGETIEETQREFIDYAADMGLAYTLIDAHLGQARLATTASKGCRLRARKRRRHPALVQLGGRLEFGSADAARPDAHTRESRAGIRTAQGDGSRRAQDGLLRRRRPVGHRLLPRHP